MADKQLPSQLPKAPASSSPAQAGVAAPAIQSGDELTPESALGMSTSGWGMASLRAMLPGQAAPSAPTPPMDPKARLAIIDRLPVPGRIDIMEKLLTDGWITEASPDDVKLALEVYKGLDDQGKTVFGLRDGGALAEKLTKKVGTLDTPQGPGMLSQAWHHPLDAAGKGATFGKGSYDATRGGKGPGLDLNGVQEGLGGSLGGIKLDDTKRNNLMLGGDAEDGRVDGIIPLLHIKGMDVSTGGAKVTSGPGFVAGLDFAIDRGADAHIEVDVPAFELKGIRIAMDALTAVVPQLSLLALSFRTVPKNDKDVTDLVSGYVEDLARSFLRETAGLGDRVAAGEHDPSALSSRLATGLGGFEQFHLQVGSVKLPNGIQAVHADGSIEKLDSLEIDDIDIQVEQVGTQSLLDEEREQLEALPVRSEAQEERLKWIDKQSAELDRLTAVAKGAMDKARRHLPLTDADRDAITALKQAQTTGVATIGIGAIQTSGAINVSAKDGVVSRNESGSMRVEGIQSRVTGPQIGMNDASVGSTSDQRVSALDDLIEDRSFGDDDKARKAAYDEKHKDDPLLADGMEVATSVRSVHTDAVHSETTDTKRGTTSASDVDAIDVKGLHTYATHNETDVHAVSGDVKGLFSDAKDDGTRYGTTDEATTRVGAAGGRDLDFSLSTDPSTHHTKVHGSVGSAYADDVETTDDMRGTKDGDVKSSTAIGHADAHAITFDSDSTTTDDKDAHTSSDVSSFGVHVADANVADVTSTSANLTKGTSSSTHVDRAAVHDVSATGSSDSREDADLHTSGHSAYDAHIGALEASGIDSTSVDPKSGTSKTHVDSATASGVGAKGSSTTDGYDTTTSKLDATVADAHAQRVSYEGGGTHATVGDLDAHGIGVAQRDSGTVVKLAGASADDVTYNDGGSTDAKVDHLDVGRTGVALDEDSNVLGASVEGLDLAGIDVKLLKYSMAEKPKTDEERAAAKEAAAADDTRFHADALSHASGTFRMVVPIDHYGVGTLTLTVPAADGWVNVDDIDLEFSKKSGKGPGLWSLAASQAEHLVHIEEGRGLVAIGGGMCICMDMNDYAGLESGKAAGGGRGRIDLKRFTEGLMSGARCTADLTAESIAELSANVDKASKRADKRASRLKEKADDAAQWAADHADKVKRKAEKADAKWKKRTDEEEAKGETVDQDLSKVDTDDLDTEGQIAYYTEYLRQSHVTLGKVQVHLDGLQMGEGDLGYDDAKVSLSGGPGINQFEIHGELGTQMSIGAHEIHADALTAADVAGKPLALADVGVRGLAVNVARPLSADRDITVHVEGTTIAKIDYGDTSKLV